MQCLSPVHGHTPECQDPDILAQKHPAVVSVALAAARPTAQQRQLRRGQSRTHGRDMRCDVSSAAGMVLVSYHGAASPILVDHSACTSSARWPRSRAMSRSQRRTVLRWCIGMRLAGPEAVAGGFRNETSSWTLFHMVKGSGRRGGAGWRTAASLHRVQVRQGVAAEIDRDQRPVVLQMERDEQLPVGQVLARRWPGRPLS